MVVLAESFLSCAGVHYCFPFTLKVGLREADGHIGMHTYIAYMLPQLSYVVAAQVCYGCLLSAASCVGHASATAGIFRCAAVCIPLKDAFAATIGRGRKDLRPCACPLRMRYPSGFMRDGAADCIGDTVKCIRSTRTSSCVLAVF